MRRAPLVLSAVAVVSAVIPVRAVGADTPTWQSYGGAARATAVRVLAIAPGGPFAGPTDAIADLTAFGAEASTSELSATAAAVGAFHGNEGVIPAARGLGPSKLDSTLAPTPLGGLPVQPPSTLPLEARAVYPSQPDAEAGAATARAVATTGIGRAAATVTSNGESGLVASHARSGIEKDGALRAVASTVIEGVAFGPVTIGRIATSAEERRAVGRTVVHSTSFDVTGLRVGGVTVGVDRHTDVTVSGVRVRVLGGDTARTSSSPVLEVRLTLPQSLVGTGALDVVYLFGQAVASVSGETDTVRSDADCDCANDDVLSNDLVDDMPLASAFDEAPPSAPVDAVDSLAAPAAPRRVATESGGDNVTAGWWVALGAATAAVAFGLAARRRRRVPVDG